MFRSLLILGLVTVVTGLVTAQEPEKTGVKPIAVVKIERKTPVSYEKDIEPILVAKCLVCHSGPVKEAKLDLSTYETLMKGGKRGKSVIASKSEESLLIKLSSRTQKPIMPPKAEVPLTPEELALIKLWIDEGAKAPIGVRERPKAVVSVPPALVKVVRAVTISPDKKFVASGRGNQLHVYDAAAGTHIRTLVDPALVTPDKKPAQAAHLSIVESLVYSPDGKLIVSGSYQEMIIWDADTGALKQKVTGFADNVVALAFSPDGKLLATGGGEPSVDGELKVFDPDTGKLAFEIKPSHSDQVFGVSFSPDGKLLASCGADKFVKVWEVPGGKFVKSFEGHTHHVLDVGWKADGKILVSAGGDSPSAISPGAGSIKVWDYEKGEQARPMPASHTRQITRMLFIPKTSQIVTCSGDQTMRILNVDNGQVVRTFPGGTDFLYAVGVSPDGTLVASGGEEGVVRLYDGAKGPLLKTLMPPGMEVKAPEAPK